MKLIKIELTKHGRYSEKGKPRMKYLLHNPRAKQTEKACSG